MFSDFFFLLQNMKIFVKRGMAPKARLSRLYIVFVAVSIFYTNQNLDSLVLVTVFAFVHI